MSAFRPLPSRPNLEFEHKEAKALLQALRAAEPDAQARARERQPDLDLSRPDALRLADAQLIIARDYGFASWPKLVSYFEDVARQRNSPQTLSFDKPEQLEDQVRSLLAGHKAGRTMTGRSLAAAVPRFYGLPAEDALKAPITEDEVRLTVARNYGAPSWEVLLEDMDTIRRRHRAPLETRPFDRYAKAMDALDLDALKAVVAEHPELLKPLSPRMLGRAPDLATAALYRERKHGREAMRPIITWLTEQGVDLQTELNRQLIGRTLKNGTEEIRALLEQGADPNWMPPNGIPIMEHALIRYWNHEAVDLIAARVTPRKAFWIAAGLGDVESVRGYLDARGRPTEVACRLRPDFSVGIRIPRPAVRDDDEVLLEAFFVAMINSRVVVMEYLASRGFNINTLAWTMPLVSFAAGNQLIASTECLVRLGADLDVRGYMPTMSARELIRELFEGQPETPGLRHVVTLFGMDPDRILAELAARPVPEAHATERLTSALQIAADDAAREGRSDIGLENVLFGLLRAEEGMLETFARNSRMDYERFGADYGARLLPADQRIERAELKLNAEGQALLRSAIDRAKERRSEYLDLMQILLELLRSDDGPAARILAKYGSSAAKLRELYERY